MILICVFFFSQIAGAGAWVQKKGGYFFKLSGSYLSTRKEFNNVGEKVDLFRDLEVYTNARFQDLAGNIYLEYGITRRWTGILNLPFKLSKTKRTENSIYFGNRFVKRTTGGPADLSLFSRYALLTGPWAVSLQGGIGIPLGYDKTPDNDGPTLGTGELSGELNLLIGKSLYPLPLYVTGGGGYRLRGGRFKNEILMNAEVGLTIKSLLFKVTFDGVKSTVTPPDLYGRPLVLPLPGGGGAFPQLLFGNQDIYKLNPGIIYHFRKRMAIEVETISIISGKDTISGTSFSLGIIFNK